MTLGDRPEVEIAISASPRAAETADLAFEDFIEAVVVADRGKNGCVGGQSDGGQGIAVKIESRKEFPGDVLRVSRTAAITRNEHLAASAKDIRDSIGDRYDGRAKIGISGGALERIARATKMSGHHLGVQVDNVRLIESGHQVSWGSRIKVE